jgi:hypothetical protein
MPLFVKRRLVVQTAVEYTGEVWVEKFNQLAVTHQVVHFVVDVQCKSQLSDSQNATRHIGFRWTTCDERPWSGPNSQPSFCQPSCSWISARSLSYVQCEITSWLFVEICRAPYPPRGSARTTTVLLLKCELVYMRGGQVAVVML